MARFVNAMVMLRIFFISFILVTGIMGDAQGQYQVYAGNGYTLTQQVLHSANGRIFPGFSFNFNEALVTVRGNKIMAGPSGSEFDLIFTYQEGKLYRGNAMYTSQIAYTLGPNGKIYEGNSTFELDVLYNVREGVIFNGSHSHPSDAMYFIEGPHNPVDLFAVLVALELIR